MQFFAEMLELSLIELLLILELLLHQVLDFFVLLVHLVELRNLDFQFLDFFLQRSVLSDDLCRMGVELLIVIDQRYLS